MTAGLSLGFPRSRDWDKNMRISSFFGRWSLEAGRRSSENEAKREDKANLRVHHWGCCRQQQALQSCGLLKGRRLQHLASNHPTPLLEDCWWESLNTRETPKQKFKRMKAPAWGGRLSVKDEAERPCCGTWRLQLKSEEGSGEWPGVPETPAALPLVCGDLSWKTHARYSLLLYSLKWINVTCYL